MAQNNCNCGGYYDTQTETTTEITVDFLYLDTSVCARCQDTEKNVDEAVSEVTPVLSTLGFTIALNKINITSKGLAEKHMFVSSPTIRISGVDTCPDVQENDCSDCGDLCGTTVDCRVFSYNGKQYPAPPKTMIVDAILKAIYQPSACGCGTYTMPENLKTFFEGRSALCCEPGVGCCG